MSPPSPHTGTEQRTRGETALAALPLVAVSLYCIFYLMDKLKAVNKIQNFTLEPSESVLFVPSSQNCSYVIQISFLSFFC